MLILGICGKRASGKTELANYLKKYGFRDLDYTRDILSPLLRKDEKPINRENLMAKANEVRAKFNEAILTEWIVKLVKVEGNWIISGVRKFSEVSVLQNSFGKDFKLIAVLANDRKRYGRIIRRDHKSEGSLSFAEFLEIDRLPTECDIPALMEKADYKIENNLSLEEFRKNTDKLMSNLMLNK